MKFFLISLILALYLLTVVIGTRKAQIRQNVRELGKLLSFPRTKSFHLDDSNAPLDPEHSHLTNDLLNVRYVTIKNICRSLKLHSNPDSTETYRTFIEKGLLKLYMKKYAEKIDMRVLEKMAESRSFPMDKHKLHKLKGKISFTAKAPDIFKSIRMARGVDDDEFMGSMTSVGPLRSGAYFFYTGDNKYILKFLRKSDGAILSQTLPSYYNALLTDNSLLSEIFGYYRIEHSYFAESKCGGTCCDIYDVVVIKNSFSDNAILKPDLIFDLKGSLHNRYIKEGATALKDGHFKDDNIKLQLGPLRQRFFDQLARDTEYMEQFQINDYSLLVGIRFLPLELAKEAGLSDYLHHNTIVEVDDNNLWRDFKGGFVARNDDGTVYVDLEESWIPIYFFSVIDLYTVYGKDRKEDHRVKAETPLIAETMSNVEPSFYRRRFLTNLAEWSNPN